MKQNSHMTNKKLTVHMGEMLRAARLKAGLTQADVAERVSLVTEVYARIERGHLTPSVLTLRTLCLVLRLDANALLKLMVRSLVPPTDGRHPSDEEAEPGAH